MRITNKTPISKEVLLALDFSRFPQHIVLHKEENCEYFSLCIFCDDETIILPFILFEGRACILSNNQFTQFIGCAAETVGQLKAIVKALTGYTLKQTKK